MSNTTGLDWQGFARFDAGLQSLAEMDARPLMERWADILVEGNRRGVLSGVDGRGEPMPPLKYRDGKGKKTANRRVPNYGTKVYDTTGKGLFSAGFNDNLTAALYRELTGPRLAPRREESRAIKNLETAINHDPAAGTWEVVGAWYQVVSTAGVPFLPFHFEGSGHNPKYDLRPVREQDMQFCANALRAFVKQEYFARL